MSTRKRGGFVGASATDCRMRQEWVTLPRADGTIPPVGSEHEDETVHAGFLKG